jgi:hypothetical protein
MDLRQSYASWASTSFALINETWPQGSVEDEFKGIADAKEHAENNMDMVNG